MSRAASSPRLGAGSNGTSRLRLSNRFFREPRDSSSSKTRASSASPLRLPTTSQIPPQEQLVFSAMIHLPLPVLVLNDTKTVVFANEAIGTLLGIARHTRDDIFEYFSEVQTKLRGQTLCQIGIDMVQNGRFTWASWDSFLDSIAEELNVSPGKKRRARGAPPVSELHFGHHPHRPRTPALSPTPMRDIAVDVVLCGSDIGRIPDNPTQSIGAYDQQIHATMIVTVWESADQHTYFTLTFTQRAPGPPTLDADSTEPLAASNSKEPLTSMSGSGVSTFTQLPPPGPPSKSSTDAPLSHLQKLTKMNDALLNNVEVPIFAMWKDGSAVLPNRAARRFRRRDGGFDSNLRGRESLLNWVVYTEDFSRKLPVEEYPLDILLRTETPFSGLRIGMHDELGRPTACEARGELIRNDGTGEVLAGLIILTDITRFTDEIMEIREHGKDRFTQICNKLPMIAYTADFNGLVDYLNNRWYEYTGSAIDEPLGYGWKAVVHPDDRHVALEIWKSSMGKGKLFATDYRILRKDGEYRWFRSHASPLRDRDTGEIYKWFATDIHDTMEASCVAKRMRQQLLTVIAHSQVTLFTVDRDRKVSMFEGALGRDVVGGKSSEFVGQNIYDVFSRLAPGISEREKLEFIQPIEDAFSRKEAGGSREHNMQDRWYRTQYIPVWEKASIESQASYIDGVIGVVTDVTEQKLQEAALEEEGREKRQALANETAAREASVLKDQFLANMSHEIRTPITGVIGMTEVLAATVSDQEQREYLGNIQRSASSLLAVVNDILDVSKIESGKLDIENVAFSLSGMVAEVRTMLSFAASKKALDFQCDIPEDIENHFTVIGDPGRVRQIVTNLVTNSVKFTSSGYVRFSVHRDVETEHTATVRFTVEDSGIGLKDEFSKTLFEPFSQGDPSTARKYGGTGLGLTICKDLLDLMHGRITLKSTPGKGTVAEFWIPFRKALGEEPSYRLPICTPAERLQWEMSLICNATEHGDTLPAPKSTNKDGRRTAPRGEATVKRVPSVMMPSATEQELVMSERKNFHVLVVEDNAVNQKIAIKFASMLGFPVAAVWNGMEALDYIRDSQHGQNTKPSIILMDCQMPVVDGYKCTHALRQHSPYKGYANGIPIIAMTASAIKGDRERCTRSGMDDYLPKPVWSKTLEKMLIKWSLKGRPSAEPRSACACLSLSGYPPDLDQPHDVDVSSLGSAGLDDGVPLSSASASPTYPRTPSLSLDGTLEDNGGEQWDWITRRPSEVSGLWSHISGTSDTPEAKAVGEVTDRGSWSEKR